MYVLDFEPCMLRPPMTTVGQPVTCRRGTHQEADVIDLDGSSLTLDQLAAIAAGHGCRVSPEGLARVRRGEAAMTEAAGRAQVYGRTTGVGANRDTASGSGAAMLRSHAIGWGPEVPVRTVRALSAIRANQLLRATSGVSPALVTALAELAGVADDQLPVVHAHGSVGTADLSALAEVGLALLGERPRRDGSTVTAAAWSPESHDADALPLMSSSALTLAQAALGTLALQRLSRRAMTTYALTHVALGGNREAVGPVVDAVTPFPGARQVAKAVRELLEPVVPAPTVVQDFFGLRCYPQVHGPLVDELARLRSGLEVLVNTGSENPTLVGTEPPRVAHHGGFHLAYLTVWLDATLLALAASARSGLSRISHLLTDPTYGLPRFLSGTGRGGNGLLGLEYAAASAVERLRSLAAAPSLLGTAHLSAGIEDDASHAAEASLRMAEAVDAYRHVVAFELLTASRALHLRPAPLAGPLAVLWERAAGVAAEPEDHDLAPDLARALTLLDDEKVWR
jgi:histidine ammonia-lyase